jgi:AcrR family transcriptional regulator
MSTDQEKKERIAECFNKHFNHFGYKKTSVGDVAKELGISKKTVYQFFSTKEKIFYFIVSKAARSYRNKMEKELADIPLSTVKIDKLIRMIFTETKKWLKSNDAFEFKYKYDIAKLAFQEAFNELLEKYVEQGIASNEFNVSNVQLTIRFFNGIISESMAIVSANPELDVEDDVIESMMKLVR